MENGMRGPIPVIGRKGPGHIFRAGGMLTDCCRLTSATCLEAVTGENMNQIVNDILTELAVTYEETIASMGSNLIRNFANDTVRDLITGGGGDSAETPIRL